MSTISNKINAKELDQINFDLQLKPSTSNVTKSVEVNDNGANNKTNLKKDTITQPGEKSDFIIKLKTIKAILESIPLVLLYELKDGKRIGNIEEVLSSKYYMQTTNDCENVLYQCLHHRIIKSKDFSYSLNQCLIDIQESLKKSFATTLDALCVSSSVQKGIPSELFDKMTSTF
jgi:hypothetical protein